MKFKIDENLPQGVVVTRQYLPSILQIDLNGHLTVVSDVGMRIR
jgi:hypothetical protein